MIALPSHEYLDKLEISHVKDVKSFVTYTR